jgi:hypothetical protein
VRRLWIHDVLPFLFCSIPVVAASVIFAALPPDARRDYLNRVSESPIDWVILLLGIVLFVSQTLLSWKAMHWNELTGKFEERGDKWINHLGQAAEWFPLLGLIGTVAAILQTFSSITPGSNPTPQQIISKYAPAITATGSGLFMALLNILPGWIVTAGRMLIQAMGGEAIVPLTPTTPSDSPYRGSKS